MRKSSSPLEIKLLNGLRNKIQKGVLSTLFAILPSCNIPNNSITNPNSNTDDCSSTETFCTERGLTTFNSCGEEIRNTFCEVGCRNDNCVEFFNDNDCQMNEACSDNYSCIHLNNPIENTG